MTTATINDDNDDEQYASSYSDKDDYYNTINNVIINMYGNRYTIVVENDNDILYEYENGGDEPMTI